MSQKPWKALLTFLVPWKRHHSQPPLLKSELPPSLISQDLFHSNRPPTEAEVTEIQAYIAQLNSALLLVQGCQSKRGLHLRELIQKQLDHHKSVLSPSRRLPYEIMSMIFLMCPQGGNLTEAPLVLCRICSQWRKIALDTPQLWCNPRCVIRLGHFDHAIAGFATWLERSGRLRPLNLSFHLKYCSPHADGHIELFEVAKSVSSRWKSLTICLSDSSSAFGLIDQLDTTNLPQLETLTMLNWWNSFSDRPYTPPANPLFSAAPALRALTIQGISPTLVPQHVFVRNLTKLRMMNYCYQDTPGRYLQLLEECSNLTYCAILCSLGPYSSYCPYFSFVRILLNALTIPHLEFVSINFQFNEIYLPHGAIYIPTLADHPRDAFLNFIERSAHTLSLVPRAVDPYCFEMAASASPTRKISRCNREWLDSGFPPFSHPFRRPH